MLLDRFKHTLGKDLSSLFGRISNLDQLAELLAGNADDIEAGIPRHDPRNYSLQETLRLLAGGIQ